MASTLAWLDHDERARSRALQVVDLFKDRGSVDELGIGTIRDTFADAFFPGTSVLHTRARYLLFIPWLLVDAASARVPRDQLGDHFRSLEVRLIYALLKSGSTDGLIGQDARETLKRMPSAVYWNALERFEIRTTHGSAESLLRAARSSLADAHNNPQADDAGTHERQRVPGIDADLPPAPTDLLREATFDLKPDEADYLRDRVMSGTGGSLLSWLLAHNETSEVDWVWEHPAVPRFPTDLRDLVEHSRRFYHAISGAPLLYNLMLAQKKHASDLGDDYSERLEAWHVQTRSIGIWDDWPRDAFWAALLQRNSRLRPATRLFVDRWLDVVSEPDIDVGTDERLRRLIASRERQLKGGRARLASPSALDAWTGSAGFVALDYRWRVARRLLTDILVRQEVSA